jgi:protein TonB
VGGPDTEAFEAEALEGEELECSSDPAPPALCPCPPVASPSLAALRAERARRPQRVAAPQTSTTTPGAPAATAPVRTASARPASGDPLRVLFVPDPRRYYPLAARAAGEHGTVLVRLTIDESGSVVEAQVIAGSGSPRLDEAALALARACRYSAGSGRRTTRLPVVFRLTGSGEGGRP